MKTSRWSLALLAFVVGLGGHDAWSAGREMQRFRSYKQIARTLRKRDYRESVATLHREVGVALGVEDLALGRALPVAAAMADSVGATHSGTNVQVEGVDEGDLVKTDGQTIFVMSGENLAAVQPLGGTAARRDSQEMELLSLTPLAQPGFTPMELHLHGPFLVVLGTVYDFYRTLPGIDPAPMPMPETDTGTMPAVAAKRLPGIIPAARALALIYDMTDPSLPVLARRLEAEGTFIGSRRVGPYLYLLTRAYPDAEAWTDTTRREAGMGLVPRVADSVGGAHWRRLLPREIATLRGVCEPSYLVITALDLSQMDMPAAVHAVLGVGSLVYAAKDSLYVASSPWFSRGIMPMDAADEETGRREVSTLHRFSLAGTDVRLAAVGRVPGRLHNQFSMDESDGVFRVATTVFPAWWSDGSQSSGVYTFDLDLNPLGEVAGLAPGERIYASRFMGNRCYLVTFRQIDPFFVVGLDDPTAPQVLGELKLPGYSSYLHALDADHVIGFGKDVHVLPSPWWPGEEITVEAGLKLSLFDVSDPGNPVEKHQEIIGVCGSDSEALHNHHAFLFAPAQQLLAFPASIREHLDPGHSEWPWQWGDFVFQGALAYTVTPEEGFQERGGLTHLRDEDYAGWGAPYWRQVQRCLLVGDALYAFSPAMATAHDPMTLERLAAVEFPPPPWDSPAPIIRWFGLPVEERPDGSVVALLPGTAAEVPIAADGSVDADDAAALLGGLLRGFLTAGD